MISSKGYKSNWQANMTRSILVSILAIIGVSGGIIPELSTKSLQISFAYSAYAQTFNDSVITNYARAVLEIEKIRQPAFNNIARIIGSEPSSVISCHQQNTLQQLPNEARTIAQNYCNNSINIVKKYGLTIGQFNQITTAAKKDPQLYKRIQNAMNKVR